MTIAAGVLGILLDLYFPEPFLRADESFGRLGSLTAGLPQ